MVHCYYCFTIAHIVNITGTVHVFFTLSSSLSYFLCTQRLAQMIKAR